MPSAELVASLDLVDSVDSALNSKDNAKSSSSSSINNNNNNNNNSSSSSSNSSGGEEFLSGGYTVLGLAPLLGLTHPSEPR